MKKGLKCPFQPQHLDKTVDQEEIVEQRIAKKVAAVSRPSYLHSLMDSADISWTQARKAQWEVAIRRWVSLIDSWDGEAHIWKLLHARTDFRRKAQILAGIFFNKAPQTLAKRVNSLGRLTNLLAAQGKRFPCEENDFYELLKLEQDRGNQADPFTVKQLLQIHKELETSRDVWVRNMCGSLLFCTYARSRWSDAQHAEKLECDYDSEDNLKYIEIKTSIHKTCRALHMRHVFLPITARAMGVSKLPRGPIWIEARNITDLKKFPLMPAPSKTLEPTSRPLSTPEVKRWLHLKENSRLTSHSCKSTCLSFMAKRGASFEDRLCLGYHSNNAKMALVYSRD